MAKKEKWRRPGPALLTDLKPFDDDNGDVRVVIETPKGSSYKLKYESRRGTFQVFAILPEGLAFPYDFGFIPSTRGEDGDPLDVLLLLDHPVPVGCVAEARLAGVLEIRQRKLGSKADSRWLRNDRFVAVASLGYTYRHVRSLDSLAPEMLEQIEAFLIQFARSTGKELEVLGRSSPQVARKRLKAGLLQKS
jgi:inorganic pyrophosphatase